MSQWVESRHHPWQQTRVLADPDMRFLGLSIWIDGREFPNATDHWDSNWLLIRASMEAAGARVDCQGPILTTSDFKSFCHQLTAMATSLAGEATLEGLEPELKVVLSMKARGHVEGVVEITPDHLNQAHRFVVEADQSYLPPLITSCEKILQRFPIFNADRS